MNGKMDNISTHSHNFVLDEVGNLVLDENMRVVCSRISDGSLVSVDQNIITEVFGVQFEKNEVDTSYDVENSVKSHCNLSENTDDTEILSQTESLQTENTPANWSRNNILKLINLYKEHQDLFKTTTIRNEKVWTIISKQIKGYSNDQCKNKFKYLKNKYIKVKDSMSDRNTGGKRIKFDYFNELEELFGKDPNVEPVAVAGCSGLKPVTPVQTQTTATTKTETSDENEIPKKKAKCKKLVFAKELKDLTDVIKEREVNKERRHQELMEKREESINVFNKYLNFLMNKEKDNKND